MSNYLNNLVTRQLERASLVQPRLPSLFEPPAHPSTLLRHNDAFEPLNVETLEVESEISAPSETRRANETRANSTSLRSPASNDEVANTVWRGRQQITSSSKSSAESTPDATREDSTQVAAAHIQASHSTPTPAQTNAARLTPLSSNAPEETAAPRLKPSTIDAAHVDSTKNDIESMESDIESLQNQLAATRKSVEVTKNSHVVQPRVVALVEQRRERDDSSLPLQSPAPEQPPPVINVTIGRIEVRASNAASHAPRRSEPQAKPLLSLDEYLRRRTKGGGA